ncbi:MAG: hypothetical protein APR63_00210 [Desulfuromonas sp. SDB]|nr:MAG: hypothetical protein APR63_00210 [Desulfuromonas sp. SDB]
MFKKMLSLVVLLVSISTMLTGGWSKYFGGSDEDMGISVQQTIDGGYIVCGFTDSWGPGNESVYLLKTDDLGEMTWAKIFGGVETDVGFSIQQCTDSGYIICGYTESSGAGNYDIYLLKTDVNGVLSWTKTLGGTYEDRGKFICQTADNGFILTGLTYSYGAGLSDAFLIKLDDQGNTLWSKYFGGINHDWCASVQQTSDGGYIICGGTSSYGSGDYDVYLIKTDQDGNDLWIETFGGAQSDNGYSVKQTSDGGYIIVGDTKSYGAGINDVYVIKTDSCGDTLWTRIFGGSTHDIAYCIDETRSGNFIITGETSSFGAGYNDVYLISISASGDLIWSKTLGGIGADCGRSVSYTADGGYIITGGTTSYGAGNSDIYLLKTDSNGVAVEETVIYYPHQISYSINQRGSNLVSLEFSLSQSSNVQLDIYDVSGRFISTPLTGSYSAGNHNVTFNMENKGVYFFSMKIDQTTHTGKYIIF